MTYFSKWLKTLHPKLYSQIICVLDKYGEVHGLLPHTNDCWCRDYMPIPLGGGRYLQYRYYPDYLLSSKNRKYITDSSVVSDELGLQCVKTDIVIDGGNVIKCGDKVIMIDKVLNENSHYKPSVLITKLERLFEAELVLLPWDRAEKYGHLDGVVRYLRDGRVLLTNYKDYDLQMHERFYNILAKRFQVEELYYTCSDSTDSSWAYINYLQTEQVIILPQFGTCKDAEALEQFNRHFIQYEGRIERVDARVIVEDGGAFNCISWATD